VSAGAASPLITTRAAGPTAGSLAGPLIYWLLVVSGLSAVTLVRLHDPSDLGPIWLGTVFGVALGQLLAFLRVRWWLPIAIAIPTGSFFAPLLAMFLYGVLGKDLEPTMLAFFPAAVSGYLSLSERGALASFWFPAVLWMLAILDGSGGALDTTVGAPLGALPFVIALGVLFVAFLRARESRRVVLWRAFGSIRIAPARPRTVLRSSPVRAAASAAWLALVGAGALVLTAWVAPLLWQKDQTRATNGPGMGMASGAGYVPGDPLPCCPAGGRREQIREYFDVRRGRMVDFEHASCRVCPTRADGYSWSGSDPSVAQGQWYYDGGWKLDPTPSWSRNIGTPTPTWHASGTSGGSGTTSAYTPPAPVVPPQPIVPAPIVPAPPPPTVAAPPPVRPRPTVVARPPAPVPTPAKRTTPRPVAVATAPAVASPTVGVPSVAVSPALDAPVEATPPWRWMLALSIAVLFAHLLVRALRRQLTLRHLARPFWNEAFDQRISNHWERMLIGLRDAGIQPRPNEAPAVFARRIGVAGMDVCATILDRVRHGVQSSTADLEQMSAAASAVYATARRKAGFAARATAWLRWPLS
jgi:hypothetical protein